MDKPSLNLTAKAGIAELHDVYGIDPDLDEIIWLHEAGKRVEDPTHEHLERIGLPARAGRAYIWPMTVMGAIWYNEQAAQWFWNSTTFLFYSLAFAMAHGRGAPIPPARRGGLQQWLKKALHGESAGIRLDELNDRGEAHQAVATWAKGIDCTRDELEAAVDEAMGPPVKVSKSAGKADIAQFVRDMAIMTGTDPDYWLTSVSRDTLVSSYAKAVAVAAGRGHSQGTSIKDASTKAIDEFRQVIVAIIERHKPK